MLQILAVTGPIYLIIAAGFLSVRGGLFTKADVRVLGRFVIGFCLPALLFNALSQRDLGEVLNGTYLVAYAVGSLAMLLGATALMRSRGRPMSLAALQGLGVSASNSGFVGYPIVLQLLGPPAAVGLALTMLVENLLVLPLALALADTGAPGRSNVFRAMGYAGRGLVKNPMIIAIALGFLFAMFGWRLPEPLARTVQIVATASSPVALFVIGGSLVGLKMTGLWGSVAGVAFGKLVLHPLAVLAMLTLLAPMGPMDPTLRTAAIVFACMPMLSIYPVLAQKHHHEGFCAAALLATTVASFFSISAVLWLLHAAL